MLKSLINHQVRQTTAPANARTPRTRRWVIGIYLVVISSLLGCHEDHNAIDQNIDTICAKTEDCRTDQRCLKGYCTRTDISSIDVGLTFIPPTSSGYLPQTLESVSLPVAEPMHIDLQTSIAVKGNINFKSGNVASPDGALIFKQQHLNNNYFTHQFHVQRGEFEGFLLPGTYSTTFIPEQSSIPRQNWPNRTLTSDSELDLSIPNPSDFVRVAGNLTYRNILPTSDISTLPQLPLKNARILAVGHDSRDMSTSATTDDDGWFEIFVNQNSGAYNLLISPLNSLHLLPEVIIEDAFHASESDILVSESIGDFNATPLALTLQIVPQSQVSINNHTTFDWSDTLITGHGTLGPGQHTIQARTNSEGIAQVNTLPIVYQFEIIPPPTSPYSRTAVSVDMLLTNSVVQVAIPLKQNIKGVVRNQDGEPIRHSRIKFESLLTAADNDAITDGIHSVSVTTDTYGRFSAWLEHGDYRVAVIPPLRTGQPRLITNLRVNDETPEELVTLVLPDPHLIYGQIVVSEVANVANITIQAHRTINGQRIIIGETQSNDNGEFYMILAPSHVD